jgi:hypothetical protein
MPSYSGVWTLPAVYQARGANNWPSPPLFSTIGAQANVSSLQLQRSGIAVLSDTVAVYTYIDYNTGTGAADLQAVVATRSGSTISYGSPTVVRSGLTPQGLSVCKLSSTTALVTYETSSNNYLAGKVLTVSGTSVSAGAEATINSVSQYPSVTRLSDTSAACAYIQAGLKVVVASVSGTTLTWNTPATVSSVGVTSSISITSLSSTSVLTVFDNANSSNYPSAVASTISGTTVTNGTAVSLESVGCSNFMGVAALSGTSAVAVWSRTSNAYGMAAGMTVSGTTITVGTPITYSAASTISSTNGAMQPITFDGSSAAYSIYRVASKTYVNKFVLSGTSATVADYQEIFAYDARSPAIAAFNSNTFMVGYGDNSTGTYASARVLLT